MAITSISFGKSAILREELKRVFPNCYFNEQDQQYSGAELVDFLKDVDAAVVEIKAITDQVLSETPQLKIVSKYGVGLDSIDQKSLKRRNVVAKNIFFTPGKIDISSTKKDVLVANLPR